MIWEELDSSTSEYWRVGLDGFSEADLMRGCDGADNWSRSKSDFTIGAFKKLCQKHVNHPSQKPFKALPRGDVLPPEEAHKRAKEILKMLGEDK